MCSEYICAKFNIEHESDLGYGKGWALINNEFHRGLTKLAFFPYGLFLVSHSVEKEIDLPAAPRNAAQAGTRTGKHPRIVPTLPDKARKIVLGMVNLILYCDLKAETDEIDGLIRSIDRSKDARHETIMNVLLKFYTSSSGVYPMRVKAGGACSVIDQPSLTLLGTAVPKFFYEALTARMLNNGFFARLMVVEADKRGRGRTAHIQALPDSIQETAKWWIDYMPGTRGNLSDWHPEPEIIQATDDSRQRLVAIQHEADERYSEAEIEQDPSAMAIWARAFEKARKLSLIYAVSRDHMKPVIDLDAANWAWEFVDYQTKRMLFMADQFVAESEFESMCNKLVEALTRWRTSHKDEWVDHRWIGNRIRGWKPNEWDAVRETLADRDVIEFQSVMTDRRPKIQYRLRK